MQSHRLVTRIVFHHVNLKSYVDILDIKNNPILLLPKSYGLNKTPYYHGALNSLHITLFDCITPTSKLFITCDL